MSYNMNEDGSRGIARRDSYPPRHLLAFVFGSLIGMLGGLIGLGGAEFRLPLLVGIFKKPPLRAININIIVSLVTVAFSFLFRSGAIIYQEVLDHYLIIVNILSGSLLGSYIGVHFATRVNERMLSRIVVTFLVFLSFVLITHDYFFQVTLTSPIPAFPLFIFGILAGAVIGVFSSLLGVAGGELIIPTLTILYAVDIKLAGSLSLAISIPTLIVGLLRYKSRGGTIAVRTDYGFILFMSIGTILGALIGSFLVGLVSRSFLQIFLGVILLLSAVKLWQEEKSRAAAISHLNTPVSTPTE